MTRPPQTVGERNRFLFWLLVVFALLVYIVGIVRLKGW
jgi:hypothetical protein